MKEQAIHEKGGEVARSPDKRTQGKSEESA